MSQKVTVQYSEGGETVVTATAEIVSPPVRDHYRDPAVWPDYPVIEKASTFLMLRVDRENQPFDAAMEPHGATLSEEEVVAVARKLIDVIASGKRLAPEPHQPERRDVERVAFGGTAGAEGAASRRKQ